MQEVQGKYFISAFIYHDSAIFSIILLMHNARTPETYSLREDMCRQSWNL